MRAFNKVGETAIFDVCYFYKYLPTYRLFKVIDSFKTQDICYLVQNVLNILQKRGIKMKTYFCKKSKKFKK